MSEIRIRNLADAPQHAEEVSRWLWEQWAKADGYSLAEIVYRTRHAMGRRGVPQMLVAEEDGAPVGVVSLWHNDAKTRQDLTPWLAALYVRPDCRGRHIGQQLQAACMETARAIGTYDKLYLITKHEHYYEKTGWIFFDRIPTGSGETERVYYHPLR